MILVMLAYSTAVTVVLYAFRFMLPVKMVKPSQFSDKSEMFRRLLNVNQLQQTPNCFTWNAVHFFVQ